MKSSIPHEIDKIPLVESVEDSPQGKARESQEVEKKKDNPIEEIKVEEEPPKDALKEEDSLKGMQPSQPSDPIVSKESQSKEESKDYAEPAHREAKEEEDKRPPPEQKEEPNQPKEGPKLSYAWILAPAGVFVAAGLFYLKYRK